MERFEDSKEQCTQKCNTTAQGSPENDMVERIIRNGRTVIIVLKEMSSFLKNCICEQIQAGADIVGGECSLDGNDVKIVFNDSSLAADFVTGWSKK